MGAKIIYVDDNAYNCEFVQRLLARWGHDCKIFTDSEQAVEYSLENPPDIVLTDIQMPKIDGYQFFTILRANQQLDETPIIAITANSSSVARSRCQAMGFDGFLAKPILRKDLQNMVEKYYRKSQTDSDLASNGA